MGFFDTLLGNSAADASNAAAGDTYEKMKQAGIDLRAYGDTLPGIYSGLADRYTPYTQAGTSALQQLLAGLGLGGDQQAFTNAYRNLPGYQAGLESGGQAVAGNANAGNMLQSGKTLKALQRFGSDYEDQRVNNYLAQLMGVTGMGQQATGSQIATEGQGLQGQLQTRLSSYGGDMQNAGTIGQGMIAGEQAKSTALGNILGTVGYLGGSYLGGNKKLF